MISAAAALGLADLEICWPQINDLRPTVISVESSRRSSVWTFLKLSMIYSFYPLLRATTVGSRHCRVLTGKSRLPRSGSMRQHGGWAGGRVCDRESEVRREDPPASKLRKQPSRAGGKILK